MSFSILKFRTSLLVLFLVFFQYAFAQAPAGYFSYTVGNGLPNNFITCLHQDKQGFLWIGTSNGLSRYDGTHYYNFPQGLLASSKIAGDLILDIEESGDFIWVAHHFGLTKINKYNLLCKNFLTQDSGAVYANTRAIKDIYKDKFGTLWLAGSNGLLKFDDKLNTIVSGEYKSKSGKENRSISKIIPENDTSLLLFMPDGWIGYNISEKKFDTIVKQTIPITLLRGKNLLIRSYWNSFTADYNILYNTQKKSITFSREKLAAGVEMVKNIYVDDSLTLFINSENGQAAKWDSNGAFFSTNITPQNVLQQPLQFNYGFAINSLPCWATGNGILISDEKKTYVKTYNFPGLLKKNLIKISEINNVTGYDDEHFLVSTKSGLFLMNWNDETIKPFARWKDSLVRRSFVLPDKTIWLSTNRYLYSFNTTTGKINSRIPIGSYVVAFQFFNDKLLIGTRSNGIIIINLKTVAITRLTKADTNKQIFTDRITSIKINGKSGNFIVTYNDGSFSINNFETGQYQPLTVPPASSVFGEHFSQHTCFAANKKLWLGQNLGGLMMYDSTTAKWTNFTKDSGLSSNDFYEILPDTKNRLWLLTGEKVDVLDMASNKIYNLSLQLHSPEKSGGFINKDGKLVIYDNSKILLIDANRFTIAKEKQQVMFSQITCGPDILDFKEKPIHLSYNKNYLSIVFSLIKFESTSTTHYSYRLKDDATWIDLGTETILNFSNFQPGNYQLQIRATDKFGQWSYYSEILPVIIHPPFWKTVWFSLLIALTVAISLYWLYRYRIRQLKKSVDFKEKISRDLHDDIGATLSSMHIYGDLAHQVWESHPAKSREMVSKITVQAKDLLSRMGDVVWSLKSSKEEKHSFGLRLKNYSQDLLSAKNIVTNFEVDDELAGRMINPLARKNLLLIAKEAMNNIAKYSDATQATIKFCLQNQKVVLSIIDNGKGFNPAHAGQGNGLSNMMQRCRQLKGECRVDASVGNGTAINCFIPIAIISHNR